MEVTCATCGKKFQSFPRRLKRSKSGSLFCSKTCLDIWQRGRPKVAREQVACATCGKIIEIAPYLLRKQRKFFCSEICKSNYSEIDVACVQCGKIVRRRRVEVEQMKQGPFCSWACHGVWVRENKARAGKNNPAWKGGYTSPNYGTDWKRQRRLARKRDKHTCQDCGITEQEWGYKLDVHHIIAYDLFDDPKEANCLDNLVTLCRKCHVKYHKQNGRALNMS